MRAVTLDSLTECLELAEQLRQGRDSTCEPQALPGRYGRVVRAVDRLLQLLNCPSVLAGGWAVWRHGYVGRVTQDLDIVLPADRIEEFLRTATVAGFDVLSVPAGRWPKVHHRDTDVTVNILPEGGRPGTATRPAPTTIPHPTQLGAAGAVLRYPPLPALLELKIASGRARDESDVIELLRANPDQVEAARARLAAVHEDYARAFDQLLQRAREQQEP